MVLSPTSSTSSDLSSPDLRYEGPRTPESVNPQILSSSICYFSLRSHSLVPVVSEVFILRREFNIQTLYQELETTREKPLPQSVCFEKSNCGITSQVMQRSMARSNVVKLVPLGADDKPRVIRELQGSIHFETTLTAATASSSSGLTIPSWFVRDHGDKVRRSALLRTELFTKPWPVNLSIWCPSLTMTQVKFAGGWQAFATFNGLLEGDVLIFVLTAMSEFKVYLFRGIEGPNKNPPPKRRRSDTTSISGPSQKKAKWRNYECGDEQVGAEEERGDQSANGFNRKSIAVYDSATAPIPPSGNVVSLHHLGHHLPSFWKTLTASNVCPNIGAALEFPEDFWRTYGSRIHSVVKLQGIHEQSPVRTMTCYASLGKLTRHYLRAEWRTFVTENHLYEGQQLVFTLSADSFFVVRERSALIATVHTMEQDRQMGNP